MLEFNVRNQEISRIDNFSPAEKSVEYLIAKFNFKTDDWDDTTKTATFKNLKTKQEYDKVIEDNQCKVPWEVLEGNTEIEVSVFGVNGAYTITTNVASFRLNRTLSGGSASTDATPSVYAQYVEYVKEEREKAESAAAQAEASAKKAEEASEGKSINVDSELSEESTNPVQNAVVTKEVNALKDTDEAVKEAILKLAIKQTTKESTFLHITDSADFPILDMGMRGITEQETVPGNQLFDLANSKGFVSSYFGLSTEIDVENNTLTTTNSHTSYRTGYLDLGILPAGTYYLAFENVNGYTTAPSIKYGELGTEMSNVAQIHYTGGGWFTIEEEMHCWLVWVVKNDNPLKLKNIMLNTGDTALPWEEYVGGMPSPNPDYNQPITLAGTLNEETGRYEHECCVGNKNLFDESFFSDAVYDYTTGERTESSTLSYGEIVEFNGKRCLKYTDGAKRVAIKQKFKENTQYAITATVYRESDYEDRVVSLYITYTDGSMQTFAYTHNTPATRISAVNKTIKYIETGDNYAQIAYIDLSATQLEIADTATDYTAPLSQPFTLTSPVPLAKWDNLIYRDGICGFSVNNGKRVFDGTEDWKQYNSNVILYD